VTIAVRPELIFVVVYGFWLIHPPANLSPSNVDEIGRMAAPRECGGYMEIAQLVN
jgi:hypothetical protein